jgi:hypothetical protein
VEKAKHRVRPENWGSAHPNEGDNEKWKHSPTTESTGDTGSNAEIDRQRAREENAPSKPATGRDSYAKEKRDADRDEALRESFPASDPPPVSPGTK